MPRQNQLWIAGALAALALGVCGARPGAGDEPKPADLRVRTQQLASKQKEVRDALRGAWERTDRPANEKAAPEYQRWTFDGDFVTTEVKPVAKDTRRSRFRYQINPLRDPPEITLHSDHGLVQGVYRLDGDVLTVATYARSELERPKGLTPAEAGESVSPLVVVTLTRVREKESPAAEWERRAVRALVGTDAKALPALAAEFQKLPAEARRGLPVAVREDAVELTYRGEVPLGESLAFLEFLIAGEDKGYETLLVAPERELKRLPALRPFFDAHTGEGRRLWWQARLSWVEDEKPRSVDLTDVLGSLSQKERAAFLDGQEVDKRGYLGGEDTTGMNVKADLALLPRKSGPAVLQLTLRRTAPKQ